MSSGNLVAALKRFDLIGSSYIPADWAPTVDVDLHFPESNSSVHGGNFLTPQAAAGRLVVEFAAENLDSPAHYTLISIDPDAPSRWNQVAGPWRHAVIEGLLPRSSKELAVTGSNHDPFKAVKMTKESPITPWLGPGPPVATGDHRYMFLLYRETKAVLPIENQSTIKGNAFVERRNFPIQDFVHQNGLVLVGANFFICANANQSKI